MKFPDQYRLLLTGTRFESSPGCAYGMFMVPSGKGRKLRVMAADAEITRWDHVSVSIDGQPTATPTWEEMCLVKSLFWDDEEEVMQIHPRKSEYVNHHKGCLHLWRPAGGFPTPDSIMVGPKS